jgi:CheY-like chemotaxis protein
MILVVDDEPGVVLVLKGILEPRGYHILSAANGEEALKLIDDGLKPCVIVLDFVMPVMGGDVFLNELQTRGKDFPVILLSAHVGGIKDELKNRIKGVIEKPFPVVEMINEIKKWANPDREAVIAGNDPCEVESK